MRIRGRCNVEGEGMTKVDEEIITALVTELQQGMLTEDQLRQGIEDNSSK